MDLEQSLPVVALDCVQVQQVLVNLIRNGIEAMDAVADERSSFQIRSCRRRPDAIRVEVRDAGTGFKDAERAFEPFFTTKPHGMGMGLAICRSIVESHGGRLWTVNQQTRGATVAFRLPLAATIRNARAPHEGFDAVEISAVTGAEVLWLAQATVAMREQQGRCQQEEPVA